MMKEDTGYSKRPSTGNGDPSAPIENMSIGTHAESAAATGVLHSDDQNDLYRLLIEKLPDAVLVECDGGIVFANQSAATLFAAQTPEALLGRSLQSLAAEAYESDVATIKKALVKGCTPRTTEEQALRLNGDLIDLAITRLLVPYHGRTAIFMVARDISERKQQDRLLRHQATHDGLTGLPNRNLLMDRLHVAIADAKRHKGRFILAFIDLDRFKWINDSFGHEAGDTLLKTVSHRISVCLRESDTIARIAGDEFVLLLREAGDHDDPMQVLDRVVSCVSKPMMLCENEITVTCSMGYCTYPDDGEDPEALLRFSDAAMYRAKELGRNNMQRYNTDVQHRFNERIKIAAELRHAIARNQFALHYQLQVDLSTGAITGLEALLRWNHPTLGNVAPSRFLPIAEETGLSEPISDWVIQQACQQNKLWQEAGLPPVRVAVNLSAKELARPGLESRVSRCLADTRLDPDYLELEFNESASMRDPDRTLSVMHKLKDLGIRLSIDNFGTGYTNMQYLKRFPIGKLKLDGSCIQEIATNPDSLAVTDAMVWAAHRLGMKVVAERAETESQVALLAACGCDQVQGHYFSMPISAEECTELLRVGSMPLGALARKLAAPSHLS